MDLDMDMEMDMDEDMDMDMDITSTTLLPGARCSGQALRLRLVSPWFWGG